MNWAMIYDVNIMAYRPMNKQEIKKWSVVVKPAARLLMKLGGGKYFVKGSVVKSKIRGLHPLTVIYIVCYAIFVMPLALGLTESTIRDICEDLKDTLVWWRIKE